MKLIAASVVTSATDFGHMEFAFSSAMPREAWEKLITSLRRRKQIGSVMPSTGGEYRLIVRADCAHLHGDRAKALDKLYESVKKQVERKVEKVNQAAAAFA